MKIRKSLMMFFAIVMLFAFSMSAAAEISPEPYRVNEEEEEETSPKTGESNIFLYSLGGAGVFVVLMIASGSMLRKKES